MTSYRVEFIKSAVKEFNKLPRKIQERVLDAINLLKTNPFSEILKVKKLKGADTLYRIRLGDYRVVYEVRKDILIIIVIKIGHRKEIYRRF